MAQRIGFYSLRKTARSLCRFVYLFDPAIRRAFPDNVPLIAALDAANIACATLVEEIDLVAEIGV